MEAGMGRPPEGRISRRDHRLKARKKKISTGNTGKHGVGTENLFSP
jgi:hypothetical protein